MKTVFCCIAAFIGIIPFTAFAQSDSGPATGGGINRSYDDGYVDVDSSGDNLGFTWNWGYQNSSQVQGGFLIFHGESYLDADTLQVITDTYDLGNLIPPPAPYSGSFNGPGPVIPDSPFSRTVEDITVPEPSGVVMLSLGVFVVIGRNWQNSCLAPLHN